MALRVVLQADAGDPREHRVEDFRLYVPRRGRRGRLQQELVADEVEPGEGAAQVHDEVAAPEPQVGELGGQVEAGPQEVLVLERGEDLWRLRQEVGDPRPLRVDFVELLPNLRDALPVGGVAEHNGEELPLLLANLTSVQGLIRSDDVLLEVQERALHSFQERRLADLLQLEPRLVEVGLHLLDVRDLQVVQLSVHVLLGEQQLVGVDAGVQSVNVRREDCLLDGPVPDPVDELLLVQYPHREEILHAEAILHRHVELLEEEGPVADLQGRVAQLAEDRGVRLPRVGLRSEHFHERQLLRGAAVAEGEHVGVAGHPLGVVGDGAQQRLDLLLEPRALRRLAQDVDPANLVHEGNPPVDGLPLGLAGGEGRLGPVQHVLHLVEPLAPEEHLELLQRPRLDRRVAGLDPVLGDLGLGDRGAANRVHQHPGPRVDDHILQFVREVVRLLLQEVDGDLHVGGDVVPRPVPGVVVLIRHLLHHFPPHLALAPRRPRPRLAALAQQVLQRRRRQDVRRHLGCPLPRLEGVVPGVDHVQAEAPELGRPALEDLRLGLDPLRHRPAVGDEVPGEEGGQAVQRPVGRDEQVGLEARRVEEEHADGEEAPPLREVQAPLPDGGDVLREVVRRGVPRRVVLLGPRVREGVQQPGVLEFLDDVVRDRQVVVPVHHRPRLPLDSLHVDRPRQDPRDGDVIVLRDADLGVADPASAGDQSENGGRDLRQQAEDDLRRGVEERPHIRPDVVPPGLHAPGDGEQRRLPLHEQLLQEPFARLHCEAPQFPHDDAVHQPREVGEVDLQLLRALLLRTRLLLRLLSARETLRPPLCLLRALQRPALPRQGLDHVLILPRDRLLHVHELPRRECLHLGDRRQRHLHLLGPEGLEVLDLARPGDVEGPQVLAQRCQPVPVLRPHPAPEPPPPGVAVDGGRRRPYAPEARPEDWRQGQVVGLDLFLRDVEQHGPDVAVPAVERPVEQEVLEEGRLLQQVVRGPVTQPLVEREDLGIVVPHKHDPGGRDGVVLLIDVVVVHHHEVVRADLPVRHAPVVAVDHLGPVLGDRPAEVPDRLLPRLDRPLGPLPLRQQPRVRALERDPGVHLVDEVPVLRQVGDPEHPLAAEALRRSQRPRDVHVGVPRARRGQLPGVQVPDVQRRRLPADCAQQLLVQHQPGLGRR